jgi:RNA polymerase sigma-70 factor (ECF subfamily)
MKPTFTTDRASSADTSLIIPWVIQAKAGDRVAFHRLVDRYRPEIHRMVYYRIRSPMDTDDLTQDIFLQAFKNIAHLKEPQVFRAWLYRIAVNRVRDFYRKKKFRSLFGFISADDEAVQAEPEMAIAPEATGRMDRSSFWRRIETALKKLSRMEREVFTLRFMDQLALKEITATLQKNESTVKTHLYRALAKLRAELADLENITEGL